MAEAQGRSAAPALATACHYIPDTSGATDCVKASSACGSGSAKGDAAAAGGVPLIGVAVGASIVAPARIAPRCTMVLVT